MWSANKQDTVTTSTTEAELLALAQAAKEGFFVSRLLHALTVRFDDKTLRIQCDNQQTIRLVEAEVAQLKTKLKHVDIHNHWLRQEVENGTLRIIYTPTDEIFADGITKPLQGDKFKTFPEPNWPCRYPRTTRRTAFQGTPRRRSREPCVWGD